MAQHHSPYPRPRPPFVPFERMLDQNARKSLQVVQDYQREATTLLAHEIIDILGFSDIHD
jgi:hypothetical protein